MRTPIWVWAWMALFSIASFTSPVIAQKPVTDADRVAAGALFDLAMDRMAKGKYESACKMLEESLELSVGTPTLYQLANCYEHIGKTASALWFFRAAAEKATTDGQSAREAEATRRANALEKGLLKLLVVVPEAAMTDGLEIRIDGDVLDRSHWNVAEPCDPGRHGIQVSAKGKQTWQRAVEAFHEPSVTVVNVPILEAAREITDAPSARPPSPSPPRAPPPEIDTHRLIGLSVVGAGVVATSIGIVLAWTASSDHASALEVCAKQQSCNEDVGEIRSDVESRAVVTAVVLSAGASAVVVGALILLLPGEAKGGATHVGPAAGPGTAGLSLAGHW